MCPVFSGPFEFLVNIINALVINSSALIARVCQSLQYSGHCFIHWCITQVCLGFESHLTGRCSPSGFCQQRAKSVVPSITASRPVQSSWSSKTVPDRHTIIFSQTSWGEMWDKPCCFIQSAVTFTMSSPWMPFSYCCSYCRFPIVEPWTLTLGKRGQQLFRCCSSFFYDLLEESDGSSVFWVFSSCGWWFSPWFNAVKASNVAL